MASPTNEYEFVQVLGDGEGQGNLVCYSLWGCKVLDTTEWLNINNNIISSYAFLSFLRGIGICAWVHSKSLQGCSTLCDPMNYSSPGSSVHGGSPGKNTRVGCHALLQGIFRPRDQILFSYVSCIGRWVLYR